MSVCGKCQKEIFGDNLYEVQGKVFCEGCAETLTEDSSSASPTGFGCIGAYAATQRQRYLEDYKKD